MSEQQRVVLAIGLCVGILLIWQSFFMPEPPAEGAPKSQTESSSVAEPAQEPKAPLAPSQGGGAQDSSKEQGAGPSLAAAPAIAPASRTFETDLLVGAVDNRQVGFSRLQLRQFRERPVDDKPGDQLSLANTTLSGQVGQGLLRWQINGQPGPAMDFHEAQPGVIHLRGRDAAGVQTSITLTPRPSHYGIDYVAEATNGGKTAQSVGLSVMLAMRQHADEANSSMQVFAGACRGPKAVERYDLDDVEDSPQKFPQRALWGGIDRQYFVVAAIAGSENQAACTVSRDGQVLQVVYDLGTESVPAGGVWKRTFSLYAGPKQDAALEAFSPTLVDFIDYDIFGIPLGFLARPMVSLLTFFYGLIGNWGIAIILLTLVVKVLTFPITYKSAVSMRRMQLLKPELDKLKAKFPNDRERQQAEQLKLFRDKGVNPLGGCLPILLQMPIWFALYRALWTDVDLYLQSFLWLPDLTAKEPGIPILAVALGLVTFVQQLLTPMASSGGAAETQQKIMRWAMPVIFTVFMIGLPSGLVLYIFVNSLLSIVQQLAINRGMKSL